MREYRYYKAENGDKVADLKTELLTVDEAWGDFEVDATHDYIPVGCVLEKYSVLLEVICLQWEQKQITEREMSNLLSKADDIIQRKLILSKNGKLTQLPR